MFVKITIDDKALKKQLGEFAKQIPFATAKALTQTAKDAQLYVRSHLDDDLTIRSNWVAKGIRISPARKNNLRAEVGSVDKFMGVQAKGGKKTRSAVPMVGKGRPRTTEMTPTRPAKWPGVLGRRSNSFIGTVRSSTPAVWQRVGRKRDGLRLLYVLPNRVDVPKRWRLQDQVMHVMATKWDSNMDAALNQAVATAKK